MKISTVLRRCKWYFIGLAIILFVSLILLLILGKSASFISVNSYHPFLLNVFFINFTFVGDGIFALSVVTILLVYFKKKVLGLAFLYSFLISGIGVQIIKNLLHAPGPKLFFESGQYLHFIDEVSLSNNASFPSGHTASAFALATVLVLFLKDRSWQLLVLIGAVLVGYSRIYLAQHFLSDVMIGAIIGTISAVIAVILVKKKSRFFTIRKGVIFYRNNGEILYN